MILVKSVEIEHVHGRQAYIAMMPEFNSPWNNDDPSESHHTTEVVESRVFRNSNGEEVIVGISHEVQNLLGMPMDSFRKMSDTIDQLKHANEYLRRATEDAEMRTARSEKIMFVAKKRMEAIKAMRFWQRLKFLFTRKGLP